MMIAVLALVCAFSACMACYAAAETLAEEKRSVNIDVVADYVKNTSDPKRFYGEITDGRATVTTDDGATVAVSGVQADGLTLVVLPIMKSETAAWEWFSSCLKNYGTNLYPVDIYFIDKNGNRVEYNGSFSISITTPETYTEPSVFYLSTDGKVTPLDSTVNGNAVTFQISHNSYYVIAEKLQSTPDDPDSPPTGDTSNKPLWIALVLVAGVGVVGTTVFGKRKRASR